MNTPCQQLIGSTLHTEVGRKSILQDHIKIQQWHHFDSNVSNIFCMLSSQSHTDYTETKNTIQTSRQVA